MSVSKTRSPRTPRTPTNISPTRQRYCIWKHCYYPHFRVTTVSCDADGCNNTMHPTCLHEFEHDIDYDEDTGKVEGSHYCPMHHPMKHKLLDEDNFESDEEEAPAKMPPLPPLLTCQECDWRLCATGCVHPELAPLSCQHEGCNKLVHHLCQIKWHESIMYEATNIARYCRIHDMKYSSRSQQQLIPTSVGGQDLINFPICWARMTTMTGLRAEDQTAIMMVGTTIAVRARRRTKKMMMVIVRMT